MGNCQTKSAAAVAKRQQGSPPPCRSSSYSIDLQSEASSVEDARLLIVTPSDEEIDIYVDESSAISSAIRADHRSLEALEKHCLELAEAFTSNSIKMKTSATATTGNDNEMLTIDTAANASAVESMKPLKSTSRSTRSGARSSSRTDSSRRHKSRSRSRRRAHTPVSDRGQLLDELDGLVASFSMPMASTSNEHDQDSTDEPDGLDKSVVGVDPPAGKDEAPAAETKGTQEAVGIAAENSLEAVDGAIVPFDTDSRGLVPAVGSDDDNNNNNNNNNNNANGKAEEVEMQLALGGDQKVCAYEVTAEEIDAVTKSKNDMMVVHKPASTDIEDLSGNRFSFRDEKRDDGACKQHLNSAIVPVTGAVPPMLTPPNDPNNSTGMPSNLYLSPESEEDEDNDQRFSDQLFTDKLFSKSLPAAPAPHLMPDGYQADSTTDIVPHPNGTTSTNEQPNAHAIVEFTGHSLVRAGYPFDEKPPMPPKISKSAQPQDNSKKTSVNRAEIEVQLYGTNTEDKLCEGTNAEESKKAIVSVEIKQTDFNESEANAEETTKVPITESAPQKLAPSSASVASMSRLSRRAKNYRATAIKKASRNDSSQKPVESTGTKEIVVEEEVSIADETKSIDLSIVECNSYETEVSEITSNHIDLDEVSASSRASHRARQLRSKSNVRRGRAERRDIDGFSEDKNTNDAAPTKNVLPPVPKASTTNANALPSKPSDGAKSEGRPSTTTSSLRLARSRRTRSRSFGRRTTIAATKKDKNVHSQREVDSQRESDAEAASAHEPEDREKKKEKADMPSDAKSFGDTAVNAEMKINSADKDAALKKNSSELRPRTLSQQKALSTKLGKEAFPRPILGEKDTAAGNNFVIDPPTNQARGPPAPESGGKSNQSVIERKARAARMKKAVDASSIGSSRSIDTAESVSNSSVENGENKAAAPRINSNSEKTLQDKKEKARRRNERARRLRAALQN